VAVIVDQGKHSGTEGYNYDWKVLYKEHNTAQIPCGFFALTYSTTVVIE